MRVDVIIKRSLNAILSMRLYATASLPFYLGEQRNQPAVGFNWLPFCQESAWTAPRCAIAEWLAIAITLPGIRSRNTFTRHPNVMDASISGFSPCQTRSSSIKCSSIKVESRRSSMLIVLQTRLSRERKTQRPTPRLGVTHSRRDQGETGSLLPDQQV